MPTMRLSRVPRRVDSRPDPDQTVPIDRGSGRPGASWTWWEAGDCRPRRQVKFSAGPSRGTTRRRKWTARSRGESGGGAGAAFVAGNLLDEQGTLTVTALPADEPDWREALRPAKSVTGSSRTSRADVFPLPSENGSGCSTPRTAPESCTAKREGRRNAARTQSTSRRSPRRFRSFQARVRRSVNGPRAVRIKTSRGWRGRRRPVCPLPDGGVRRTISYREACPGRPGGTNREGWSACSCS
jgi:hypothetical protein